jgi:hypothetical protein
MTAVAAFQTTDRTLVGGAFEANGLVNGSEYHAQVDYSKTWSLAEVAEAGGRITRVRILTEGIMRDISYIHATLPGGQTVNVENGVPYLTKKWELKGEMINWAKREGVYAKGLGLLDEGNWSVLY